MSSNIKIPWPGWKTTGTIGRDGSGMVYEIQKKTWGRTQYAALKVVLIPERTEVVDVQGISAQFRRFLENKIGKRTMMADFEGGSNKLGQEEVKTVRHDNGVGQIVFVKVDLQMSLNPVASTAYTANPEENPGRTRSGMVLSNEKSMLIALVTIAAVLAVCLFMSWDRISPDSAETDDPQISHGGVLTEAGEETDRAKETDQAAAAPEVTEHVHSWNEATCTAPQTCSTCGETTGETAPHQWREATYDSPEYCPLCGATRGDSIGYPLTWCYQVENSNNPDAKRTVDVDVGTWKDCFGQKHPDSVKFWVNASMIDTEYIVYEVDSEYSKLVLTMVNAEDNASSGKNRIMVYADGNLIYQSDWISNSTAAFEVTLDIENVWEIKVECDTDTRKNCYCLASGLLYK